MGKTILRSASLRGSAALLACAFFFVAAPLALAADSFRVRLSPVPIDASNRAQTTGSGTATAVLDGSRLTLSGEFRGLAGAATKGELKSGVAKGVRGASFAQVAIPDAVAGTFKTQLTLTAAQVEALKAGRVYLEIASTAAPDGNLWGWLLP